MAGDNQKLGEIRFVSKAPAQEPIDLEAFEPHQLIKLVHATIIRSKVEGIRPGLYFWTRRPMVGKRAIVFADEVRGVQADPGPLKAPDGATFVRVWASELEAILSKRHPELWFGTEQMAKKFILGTHSRLTDMPRDVAIRRCVEFAGVMQKTATADGAGTALSRPWDATSH